jgi:hypothetical protein
MHQRRGKMTAASKAFRICRKASTGTLQSVGRGPRHRGDRSNRRRLWLADPGRRLLEHNSALQNTIRPDKKLQAADAAISEALLVLEHSHRSPRTCWAAYHIAQAMEILASVVPGLVPQDQASTIVLYGQIRARR